MYDPDRADNREVFLTLLKVYLTPNGAEPPQVQLALRLLTEHHSKMDPAKVERRQLKDVRVVGPLADSAYAGSPWEFSRRSICCRATCA